MSYAVQKLLDAIPVILNQIVWVADTTITWLKSRNLLLTNVYVIQLQFQLLIVYIVQFQINVVNVKKDFTWIQIINVSHVLQQWNFVQNAARNSTVHNVKEVTSWIKTKILFKIIAPVTYPLRTTKIAFRVYMGIVINVKRISCLIEITCVFLVLLQFNIVDFVLLVRVVKFVKSILFLKEEFLMSAKIVPRLMNNAKIVLNKSVLNAIKDIF